jgi:hypothetical protein
MFRKSPEQQQFEDKIEEIFLLVQGKQFVDGPLKSALLGKFADILDLCNTYPHIDVHASVKTSKMAHRETLLTLAATYFPIVLPLLLHAGILPLLTPTMWMSSPLKRLMDYQPQKIKWAISLVAKDDSPYVVDKEGKNVLDLIFKFHPSCASGIFSILEKKKWDITYLMRATGLETHQLAARWLCSIKGDQWAGGYSMFKWIGDLWKGDLFSAICKMDLEEGTRLLEACIDPNNGLGRVFYWQRIPSVFGGKACSLKSGVLKKVVDELLKRKPELLEKIESRAQELEYFNLDDKLDESKAEGLHYSL